MAPEQDREGRVRPEDVGAVTASTRTPREDALEAARTALTHQMLFGCSVTLALPSWTCDAGDDCPRLKWLSGEYKTGTGKPWPGR